MANEINKEKKKSADAFDLGRLASQVRLAIGGRSLSSFAEEAGVSKSYISKIVNGKISPESPPSRKVLIKIANPKTAAPENGITLSDLFSSCGYSITELEDEAEKGKSVYIPALCSTVQKHYSKGVLPMAAVSLLMNGLAFNGAGEMMKIETKSNYFMIRIPESDKTYIGIPAFCRQKNAFELMYRTVLSALLVLSTMDAVFYVLTDDREMYKRLASELQIPPKMHVSILYTEDYVFIEKEFKIGDSSTEWNPASVVTALNSVVTTK